MPDIATSEPHQRTASPEASAAAFHESGHAVAVVRAFRDAAWLPSPPPALPVTSIEIAQDATGRGSCAAINIYSAKWPNRTAERYRPLMEAQVTIHLAGGIAEAIHLGQPLTTKNLSREDLGRALALLDGDLHRLTGQHHALAPFLDHTRRMLTARWPAVTALASALITHGRVEGREVERIIDRVSASGTGR